MGGPSTGVPPGLTDYPPDVTKITVLPGTYCVRIYYGNLDSLSPDGLDGNDRYKVALWKETSSITEPIFIKRRIVDDHKN